jgi:DNA sulfur modification protein DndD
MKLDCITLQNFRQFYGEQAIECSDDPERNVTLIHAENGVGKTTLLNSILWAFYGATTDRFEQREKIINFEAAHEGRTTASVSVTFDLKDERFAVQRHFVANSGKPDLRLKAFRVEDGVHKDIPAAETFINSVLPREMARYFFFDGEHAEAFAAENNREAVGEAIRNMLGCELAETAIADLKHISTALGREMGNVEADQRMSEIERDIEGLEQQQEKKQGDLAQLEKNISAYDQQISTILSKLRDMEGAREIQKSRDSKVSDKNRIDSEIRAAEDEIVRWVGSKSILVVAKKLSEQTLDFIDEASLRGRIPSPYNEEFVKGLLSAKLCVCDRPLEPGSESYGAVMNLLKSASNAETMRRVMQARGRVQQFKETAPDAVASLEKQQQRLGRLQEQRMVLEQEIAALSKRLEDLPLTEIAERERARREAEQKRAQALQDLGVLKRDLFTITRRLDELGTERDRLASRHEKTRRIMLRRDLARGAAEKLGAILEAYEADARNVIELTINKILKETTRRDYKFRFNEDFSMQLLYADGRPVPRSGGENQLMSLAFTAALVEFARLRLNAQEEILTPGTIAPLILDSPFGQLDRTYREATAKFVPKMASQVILLVSSSQGDDTVMKALEPRVGAEYVLISENRGPRGAKPADTAYIRNKEYQLSLYDQPKTLTRIERVL